MTVRLLRPKTVSQRFYDIDDSVSSAVVKRAGHSSCLDAFVYHKLTPSRLLHVVTSRLGRHGSSGLEYLMANSDQPQCQPGRRLQSNFRRPGAEIKEVCCGEML